MSRFSTSVGPVVATNGRIAVWSQAQETPLVIARIICSWSDLQSQESPYQFSLSDTGGSGVLPGRIVVLANVNLDGTTPPFQNPPNPPTVSYDNPAQSFGGTVLFDYDVVDWDFDKTFPDDTEYGRLTATQLTVLAFPQRGNGNYPVGEGIIKLHVFAKTLAVAQPPSYARRGTHTQHVGGGHR